MALRTAWKRGQRILTNKAAQLALGAVGSVGLAWAVLHSLEWGEVLRTFQELPIGATAMAFIPVVISQLLRGARWWVLLRGQRVSFWQVFLTQSTGFGLNNLLPVRMVAEPVSLALITRRYHVAFPTAFATLVAANILDIFATALLMGLGVLLVPELRGASIQLVGAGILAVVSLLVLVAVSRGLSAIPLAKGMHFFQRLMSAVSLLQEQPGRLVASFLLTLAHWLVLGISGWLIASAVGFSIHPITMATLLVAATFFTSAVPSLPAAAGTYEFAMIYTLRQMGVDPHLAFSFAVVMHVVAFLPSSLIAVYMLWHLGADVIFRREPHTDLSTGLTG